MKALVIYDSYFGNTKLIAEAIAKELGGGTLAKPVVRFNKSELEGTGLLIVGSPIRGWRPSERMGEFLASLGRDRLKGIKAAAFDTRIKLFIHGDAARKISKALENAGAKIIAQPQVFFVKGSEGPLFDGEIEKATQWATMLKTK